MCILSECNNKSKNLYGEYCYKHRREYLIEKVNFGIDNKKEYEIVNIERWTNKLSDYLKKDILTTLFHFGIIKTIYKNSLSKGELFILLSEKINSLKKYNEKDIQIIIKFQKGFKNGQVNRINKLRGEGFLNKKLCNNEVDFYSFETVDELDNKYFFSYKDESNFIWFFDIRSFNKLIEMKQPNPYTMKSIPKKIINRSKKLTRKLHLTKNEDLINYKQIKQTRKQIIKQKTIDLFSDIEQAGYYCQPEWLLKLSIVRIRRLYRNLEDLWNYRLQLTNAQKSRICPPNGVAFNRRVNEVMNCSVIEDIQNLILNEVIKFQNAHSPEDKKLGYLYFIIGLGSGISQECFESHPWIASV